MEILKRESRPRITRCIIITQAEWASTLNAHSEPIPYLNWRASGNQMSRVSTDPHSTWPNLWQRGWETHSSLLIQTCVKAITCIRGILLEELCLPWSGRRDLSSGDGDRGGSLAAPREMSVGMKFLFVPCL